MEGAKGEADSCADLWGHLSRRNTGLGRKEWDKAQQGQLHHPAVEGD